MVWRTPLSNLWTTTSQPDDRQQFAELHHKLPLTDILSGRHPTPTASVSGWKPIWIISIVYGIHKSLQFKETSFVGTVYEWTAKPSALVVRNPHIRTREKSAIVLFLLFKNLDLWISFIKFISESLLWLVQFKASDYLTCNECVQLTFVIFKLNNR